MVSSVSRGNGHQCGVPDHEPPPSRGPGPAYNERMIGLYISSGFEWRAGSGMTISAMELCRLGHPVQDSGIRGGADAGGRDGPAVGRGSGEPAQVPGLGKRPRGNPVPHGGPTARDGTGRGLVRRPPRPEAMIFTIQTKDGEVIGNCGSGEVREGQEGHFGDNDRLEGALGQRLRDRCRQDAVSGFASTSSI